RTYAEMKSYEDRCETTATGPGQSLAPQVVMEERFSYQAPNRFFWGVHSGDQLIAAAACDGKTIQCVHGDRPYAMRAEAPKTLVGSVPLLRRLTVPLMNGPLMFLVGADPLAAGRSRLLDDETLDGQTMRVVEISGDQTVRLWVGEKDHLLHRVQRTVIASQGAAPQAQEVTDTRKQVSINQPVPPNRLAFALPSGFPVQQVVILENRPAPPVKLASLDGQTYDVASLKGKAVVLTFWAFW